MVKCLEKTTLKNVDLQNSNLTDAIISKKSLEHTLQNESTRLPQHFSSDRTGYERSYGGAGNKGIKVGKFVTKRVEAHTLEPHNLNLIEQRLQTLDKTHPETANALRQNLVKFRGSFTPKAEPHNSYLVMERAKGNSYEDIYTKLTKEERQRISLEIKRQQQSFEQHLGLRLNDRRASNVFVETHPETNRLILDENQRPKIQHIDFGWVDWLR